MTNTLNVLYYTCVLSHPCKYCTVRYIYILFTVIKCSGIVRCQMNFKCDSQRVWYLKKIICSDQLLNSNYYFKIKIFQKCFVKASFFLLFRWNLINMIFFYFVPDIMFLNWYGARAIRNGDSTAADIASNIGE